MKKTIIFLIALCIVIPVLAMASGNFATIISNEGKKMVVKIGSHIPSGWKLFTKPEMKIGSAQVNFYNSVATSSVTTVAGKASVVLSPNTGRHYAVVTNTTATIAYLAFNATTSATQLAGGLTDGEFVVPLAASGGSYVINLDNLYTGQLIASSSAAVVIRALDAK